MDRLVRLVTNHPLAIVTTFAVACIAALTVHFRQAHYDFSFETMAPRNTVEWARSQEFNDVFGKDDELYVIAFQADPLLTNENLAMISRITDRLEALTDTGSIVSLTNVLDIRGNDEGLEVDRFVGDLPLAKEELEALKERFTSDPIVTGNLISPDGRTAAIVGRMTEWSADPKQRMDYFDAVERILADESKGRVEFHLAGIPYMDRTMMNHIIHDTSTLLPVTLVVLAGAMWLAFGQLRAVWIPTAPIVIAAALTLGTLSLLKLPMSVLTGQGVLSTLIIVIGLSDGVHLLNRYGEDLANHPGKSRPAVLGITLRHMAMACFLTSLTTAIGFASMMSTDIPTIRDFGLLGGAGVMYAYVGAILFIPAAILLMDRWRPSRPRDPARADLLDRLLAANAKVVLRHPRAIVAAAILTLLASAAGVTLVRIDNRFTRDMKKSEPAVVSLHFLENALGGAYRQEFVVKGPGPDAIKDPRTLAAMGDTGAQLEKLPYVSKILSPVPFIEKMNRALNGGAGGALAIPATRELVAQYLLLFELAGSDSEFDKLVNYDYSIGRMTARITDITPTEYEDMIAHLRQISDGKFPAGVEIYESGEGPLFHSITKRLIGTLVRSLYLAMPLIFLIIGLEFRSVKLGMLSVLPNLMPLTVGMGFMGATDMSLRFSTIVAFPVAFGLAVDNTIHFLARYRLEMSEGRSPEDAVRATLETAGRAMVLTTAFLVAGYTVLALSSFLGVIHMGLLVCVILIAALAGDLFVTPALVLVTRPDVRTRTPYGRGREGATAGDASAEAALPAERPAAVA